MNDKELKFRKEVSWCVEQLRMGISNKHPTQKQVKECERVLKVLTSSKAPVVKKRQVMHQMFGDYRKKMENEERTWETETLKQLQHMKISSKSTAGPKSEFYKTSTTISNSSCNSHSKPPSNNENFLVNNTIGLTHFAQSQKEMVQNPHSNSFRFNFVLDS